jgi:hypothetical protein
VDLADEIDAATALGNLRAKLLVGLGKALNKAAVAGTTCLDGDAKKAAKQLKPVVRQLIKFSHRLRSRAARKHIPEEVREPLAAQGDAIQTDARTLRLQVVCPPTAGSS